MVHNFSCYCNRHLVTYNKLDVCKNTHFSADAVLIQHQLSEKANKYTRLHKHVKISGYSINMLWWNHLLHQSKPTNYILCSFYRTLLRSDINVSACTRRKNINCPYKFFSHCIYFQSRSSHICKCNWSEKITIYWVFHSIRFLLTSIRITQFDGWSTHRHINIP